jgi:hypothetical protein
MKRQRHRGQTVTFSKPTAPPNDIMKRDNDVIEKKEEDVKKSNGHSKSGMSCFIESQTGCYLVGLGSIPASRQPMVDCLLRGTEESVSRKAVHSHQKKLETSSSVHKYEEPSRKRQFPRY